MLRNVCLLFVLSSSLVSGCATVAQSGSSPVVLATKSGAIQFTFPGDWKNNTDEHPFDLQVLSKDERANTGVFEWRRSDLAQELTPRKLLELQIDDMKSKRTNFDVFIPESVSTVDGKTLTSVVFAGEKGPRRYLYAYTLIAFDAAPDLIVIVLQVVVPSEWEEMRPMLRSIAESAKPVPDDAGR